jgi:uncharacterized protein
MSRLRIARGFALPVDVAGEAIAILAKRGAGKTNTGRVLVEELHGARVPTVVLDPVGAWWGLRSSADGGKDGLPLPVLGGAHGDVPLQAAAGALLANVVVDTGQSLVLDLSDFSKTEQRRFVTDFAERLYTRKARDRTLLHLVLEEADEFAPQRVSAGDARMVGSIEQLVRRGRGRGIGLTMITQRSASLNKSVLEQTDVLIIMRTTGPRDRAAVEAWVAKQDVDGAEDVLPSLSGLETGEAWIWNPERGLLERVRIRLAKTFDSSSTPKAGERRVEPAAAAAIDLTKLGAEIEATAERAKENDPTELRKQLRELKQRVARADENTTRLEQLLAERPLAETVVERVEVPVVSDGQVGRLENVAKELREVAGSVAEFAGEIVRAIDEAHAAARAETVERREEVRPPVARPPARPPSPPAPRPPQAAASNGRVSGPQQRILDALAALEAIGISDAHKTQLALFAHASPKSSSYSNNLGALRTAGLIDYPAGGRVHLTPDGRSVADGSAAPSSTEELHRFVYDLVGGSKARLLEQLVAHYPGALEKEQLAELAGASATSSSFSNNLGSLRSLGLIDYPRPGDIAALPVLFLEERA